jgi:LysM repeat protein
MKNRLFSVVVLLALLLAGFSFPSDSHAGGTACHLVQRGETLAQIAYRYGTTVQALAALNNLHNPNVIYVGQCLLIPGGTTPPPSTGCTITYVVQRGEYLKQIAARYGVDWQVLAQINGLSNPNLIYPGQRLTIPVQCQPPPKPKPKPTPKPTGPPSEGAWEALFWNNRYLSGPPKFTRYYDKIDFDFDKVGPGGGIGAYDYSIRFTRTRWFDENTYRFTIRVDDGVRLWVDGVLLIDEWHDTGPVTYTTDKQLSAGLHRMRIDYYQNAGGALISFAPVPVGTDQAWTAEFFNNITLSGAPVATRTYKALDFNWKTYSPTAGVTADFWSARFTGQFGFNGGNYRFWVRVDDGARLYLDDQLIIDQWHIGAVRTFEVSTDVAAGTHTVKVEYFENTGGAVLAVGWVQR